MCFSWFCFFSVVCFSFLKRLRIVWFDKNSDVISKPLMPWGMRGKLEQEKQQKSGDCIVTCIGMVQSPKVEWGKKVPWHLTHPSDMNGSVVIVPSALRGCLFSTRREKLLSFLVIFEGLEVLGGNTHQGCSQQQHTAAYCHISYSCHALAVYISMLFLYVSAYHSPRTFVPTPFSRDCFYPPSIDSFSFCSSVAWRQRLLRKTPILVAFAVCFDKRRSTFPHQKINNNNSCSVASAHGDEEVFC